jgi:hypothetical protein
MTTKPEQINTLKFCRRKNNISSASKKECRAPMFESEWEEFVIKKEPATGRLVALFACCAGATV